MKLIRSTLSSLILASGAANAATIVVNNTSCDLPSAILAANTDTVAGGCPAGSGSDVIEIRSRVRLRSVFDGDDGTPPVIGKLTINAHNNQIVRTFSDDGFRLLHVALDGDLTLNEAWLRFGETRNFGAAIFNEGKLTVNRSTISENLSTSEGGGGIANRGDITINNTTIANNDVYVGGGAGGLYSDNPTGQPQKINITNSTITGNSSAGCSAADILGPTTATLLYATITDNIAKPGIGGLCIESSANVSLQNTVIANSRSFINFPPYEDNTDCLADTAVADLGGNLIEHDYNCDASAFAFGTDPHLAPLAMNGGPTPTHEPLASSPLINATNCTVTTDQRGISRPQPPGGQCDIGSVERVALDAVLTSFDTKIKKGRLIGTGKTQAIKRQHTQTYRKVLVTSVNYLIKKNPSKACGELKKASTWLDRDGRIKPSELVTGRGAKNLYRTIKSKMKSYKCR